MASLFTTSSPSYWHGYFNALWSWMPTSLTDWYGTIMSQAARLISLPLPLLSFIALPFFGGTSTSISLFFFYLTWAAVVFSHSPLEVEIMGSLIVRLVFFLLPALAFLAFDWGFPGASKSIKTLGGSALPHRLGRDKLLEVVVVASGNIALSVILQALFEVLFTKVLLMRSLIKVSSILPLPLSILQDFLRGFVVRGLLHYWSHRYLLHGGVQPLTQWHKTWQHSVQLPVSLVAAYDHPVCFVVGQLLPTLIPAYLFRFHVLTFHLYLALVSLEQLLIYSGYSVLPSRIILGGMAQRIDAHFYTIKQGRKATNFGHWGVLDLVFGTTCKDTVDFFDDVKTEASKHRIKERASAAVEGAVEKVQKEERRNGRRLKTNATDYSQDNTASDEAVDEANPSRKSRLLRRRKE